MWNDFLPIAERELRAAARQRNSRRLRWWSALFAIVASFLKLAAITGPTTAFSSLFGLQSACAFGFALLAGAFLTSDSLSEEKRDGTLSLLFLTRIRAGDIVLGKFAGISLNALYGLLAVLPVTAIPLLLGGVGLGEFGRMVLALINTLFFSLAIGLGVSAWVTDYARGLAGSLGLLILFGAGLPALTVQSAKTGGPGAGSVFVWLTPFYPFCFARDSDYALNPSGFWAPLLGSHLMGWVWLALAGSGLRRSWMEHEPAPSRAPHRALPSRTSHRRAYYRSSKVDAFDPVRCLVGDVPLFRRAVWFLVAAWAGLLAANRLGPTQLVPELLAAKGCAFLLKLLVAIQACRIFVELRRSGALEVLLCTPLRNADLVRAQWRTLLRIFAWPLAIFLLLSWGTLVLPIDGSALGFGTPPPNDRERFLELFFLSLELAADVLAIGWFGMWLALTSRKPGLAPALTIIAVLILPAMLFHFDLVADMLFISWGTTRFQEEFRWMAAAPLPPSDNPESYARMAAPVEVI